MILYRTYALYQDKHEYNVIKGVIPDFGYDVKISFTIDGEKSNKTFPKKNSGYIAKQVSCKDDITAEWDNELWGLININVGENQIIRCSIDFEKQSLVNKTWETLASNDENVCGENDLVIVNHDNANIEDVGYSDYSLESETAISSLKQTEYRYCGSNPDNYITFNDEDAGWRIIGLVNTPDGQRIKLIKTSSIGYYSFDNFGDYGLNDWTRSSLQNILNNGAYYNRTTGDCPSGKNGSTITCNFETNGLKDSAKLMIDENIIWNLGGYKFLVDNDPEGTTDNFYSHERGKELYSGKSTLWKGNGVGLIYPSDYGYATNGGDIGRKACLNYSLFIWNNYSSCFDSESNWLYKKGEIWTLTSNSIYSGTLLIPISSGRINNWDAVSRNIVYPVVYLKPNIKIISGTGEIDNPYILSD